MRVSLAVGRQSCFLTLVAARLDAVGREALLSGRDEVVVDVLVTSIMA